VTSGKFSFWLARCRFIEEKKPDGCRTLSHSATDGANRHGHFWTFLL